MKSIESTIEQCDKLVSKWAERPATVETLRDFAGLFDMELAWAVTRKEPVGEEASKKPDEQYEMFNELSFEDKYAMKTWRENNGLAWR